MARRTIAHLQQQVARRIHDGAPHHCAPAAAGASCIRWRTASLMARRMIARLQQRALAADQVARRIHDGALHHCTPAAAGAGRIRWRAASLMARRMIARLQQRALAASAGAPPR
jgi:hypothetical protein